MKHRGNRSKNGLRIICAAGIILWCAWMQTSPRHTIRFDASEHIRHAAADRGLPPHRISGDAVLRFFSGGRGAESSSIQWTPLSAPNFSGRITALAISPQHPDTVLAGVADGGIWRSTDGGGSFSPVFDFAPTLSIGSLAFDPVQPTIAYAGTGEVNASLDSYPGAGIFKSTDAGATWISSGLSAVPYISSIVVNPENTNELFVAGMGGLLTPDTIGGVFHSTDGGNSWTKIFSPGDSVGVIDLQYTRLIAPIWLCATWQRLGGGGQSGARSAIYRSTDMGTSWEKITKGLPASDSLTGRIAIAPSLSTPNVVYASFEEFSPISDYGGIYRSTDAGNSWSAVSGFPGNLADFYQGWYDKVLAVNPLNDNCVLFGDKEMYYTSNAGVTWANVSNTPLETHVDQHAIAYNRSDTATIFAGNDGGIYKLRFDSAWQFLPVPVTQFYSSAIDTNRPWFAIGGTQDNGLLLYNDTTNANWFQPEALTGDFGNIAVNPFNAGTILTEHLYLTLAFTGDGMDKSTDSGVSWININSGININDYAAAVPPLMYDPRDTNVLYVATNRIYRSTNGGAAWSSISPRLTADSLSSVTALAINAGSVIFVAGASDGTVSVSTNGGNMWTTVNSPVPGRWITSLTYDDLSGALYAGSASGAGNSQTLYRSTNLGATWQSVSTPASGFPPAAVNSIIVDDKDDSILIAGTDIGVYATRDLGAANMSWEPLGAGLPHAAVVQMNLNRRTRILRAATHGRDMWQFDLGAWEQSTAVHEQMPENVALDLQAYPDPFTNTITVSLSSSAGITNEGSQFEIIDLNGAVQRIYKGALRSVSFDVASLPSGVYLARACSGTWSATRKLLLVR